MTFKVSSSSLEDKAYFAIEFLRDANEKKTLQDIENIDEILDILESAIDDYGLALSELTSNHIR